MVDINTQAPFLQLQTHSDKIDVMDTREYKITVGIRSYWITKEDLDKYLTERAKPGVTLVALSGGKLFLPTECQDIAHRDVIDAAEKITKGSWQCQSGKWHSSLRCYCNIEMVENSNGTMTLIDRSEKFTLPSGDDVHSDNLRQANSNRY